MWCPLKATKLKLRRLARTHNETLLKFCKRFATRGQIYGHKFQLLTLSLVIILHFCITSFCQISRLLVHVAPAWREKAFWRQDRLNGLAPSYLALAPHCKPTSSCPGRSHLRSATSGHFNFRRTKTDYGKRSFPAVSGPLLSGTAYLLNFGHLTSRWTFSKPDWRHFCLTADLAHLCI